MENKINYIVREVPAEQADLSFYFEDDGLTEAGGDWNYNLFIVCNEGWGRISGFNIETYKNVQKEADGLLDAFDDVERPGSGYCWTSYGSYKEAMEDYGIPYNPTKCHKLKEWAKAADTSKTESIAEYLTIKTGKEWGVVSARGYSQGDYCEVVYCKQYHSEPEAYGEIYLGAAKEFCVIEVENYKAPDDENDEATYDEGDAVYGFIVADCQIKNWRDSDAEYKRMVCDWYGCDEAEAALEMIDWGSVRTVTHYNYRTA